MRLTTARYFTPSGRSIQAVGIEPDIIVELAKIESITTKPTTREADLRGALENSIDAPSENKSGASKKEEFDSEKKQDYQLDRALDLIRGLALFSDKVAKSN